MYVPDNYDQFERHDREQEEKLNRLPVCSCCGHPIQTENAIRFNDDWYCEDCEDEAWEEIRKEYLESTDI